MKKNRLLLLLLTGLLAHLAAQEPVVITKIKLPVIDSLDSYNPVFIQYCEEVETAYKDFASGRKMVQNFYRYTVKKNDTLLRIAARCSLPYETIATINDIPATKTRMPAGTTIILPVAAGIFVADKPESNIELLLRNKYDFGFEDSPFLLYTYNNRVYCFLENVRFDATIRAFFLDSGMQLPVAHGVLTSPYGIRKSPITGRKTFHRGIDLAVPIGTEVSACKQGFVATVGRNHPIFGNYVILKHDNGMTSVYAHLSRILVKKGEAVYGGSKIGLSGTSGESTGPHLHFEVRINGISENPLDFLPAK